MDIQNIVLISLGSINVVVTLAAIVCVYRVLRRARRQEERLDAALRNYTDLHGQIHAVECDMLGVEEGFVKVLKTIGDHNDKASALNGAVKQAVLETRDHTISLMAAVTSLKEELKKTVEEKPQFKPKARFGAHNYHPEGGK